MKILYAASEATPFAKSGGLADVAGSLPKALVKDGCTASEIITAAFTKDKPAIVFVDVAFQVWRWEVNES